MRSVATWTVLHSSIRLPTATSCASTSPRLPQAGLLVTMTRGTSRELGSGGLPIGYWCYTVGTHQLSTSGNNSWHGAGLLGCGVWGHVGCPVGGRHAPGKLRGTSEDEAACEALSSSCGQRPILSEATMDAACVCVVKLERQLGVT